MTEQALARPASGAQALERVLIEGDLATLSPEMRIEYYNRVCESMSLNPLTKPFDYLRLNNRLVLYAKRDATDQLRKLHGVSITKLERERLDDVYCVTAYAATADGRTDSSLGAVPISGLKGEALANAYMKAETKSKRRVTLSICGLGMLDELEVSSIPGAQPEPTIVDSKPLPAGVHASTGLVDGSVVESTARAVDSAPAGGDAPATEPTPEGEAAPITAWFALCREHLHLTRAQTRSYFATNTPMDSDEDAVRAVLSDLDLKPTDKALSRLFTVVSDAVLAKQNEARQPAMAGGASDKLICEQCGAVLTETVFRDGTRWEIAQLASLGQRKHGRVLCLPHYKAANTTRLADAPAPVPA